jgi:serine/threonine protein phosphatase PrpC
MEGEPADIRDGFETGTRLWRVLAASVRGSGHEKTGKPCQDASSWKLLNDHTFIGAVADGAGSADYSDVGARLACEEAIHECESAGEEIARGGEESIRAVLESAARRAREALEREAVSRDVQARDLATTLILVVATQTTCACLHVGDGGVVVEDTGGDLHVLSSGDRGEYINETTFIVSADGLEKAQFASLSVPLKGIAAFSDGLQLLALDIAQQMAHAPFFQPLFRFCEDAADASASASALEAFLASGRVRGRTDDDVTLLIATRLDVPAA